MSIVKLARDRRTHKSATSDTINRKDTRYSHAYIHDIGCNGDEERIFDARILEERGSVVENEAAAHGWSLSSGAPVERMTRKLT